MIEPTVAVVGGSPDTWHRRLHVGLLALGPAAWVSHEAAAALHGLDRSPHEPLEFTVRRTRRRACSNAVAPNTTTAAAAATPVSGAAASTTTSTSTSTTARRVHSSALFGLYDVLRIEGLRCASATRTILDLATLRADANRIGAAIDSAVRLRLSAPLVIEKRLATLRGSGRYGVRLIDRLLVDSGGESILERRFLRLVREAGLPRPSTQRRIRRGDRHVARVDFLYERERVVIEVSGRLGHSTPSDRAKDAQRRNELQDLGFVVYEYTWGDFAGGSTAGPPDPCLCPPRPQKCAGSGDTNAAEEVGEGGVDLGGPFLLDPVAGALEHDGAPVVGQPAIHDRRRRRGQHRIVAAPDEQ